MDPGGRLRVLVLADQCNPEWPSLPIVGYKYALALSTTCDVVVVTQVRNETNIRKLHPADSAALRFCFLDTEYIARPLHQLSMVLRRDPEMAWSTSQMMNYLPYLEFERQAWLTFRNGLGAGEYDVIHRITPMSPTMPSWLAGRAPQPFVIGPLNGNLDWPAAFTEEKKREREGLRGLRDVARYLPYARRTWRDADAVLAAFQHTVDDLRAVDPAKILMFPEVGFDDAIFHPPPGLVPEDDAPEPDAASDPTAADAPLTFLFAGRLVPYKLAEVALRAFAGSPSLVERHRLRVVGDGPERPRLEALVAELGSPASIVFEGRKDQRGVAEAMRESEVFVFPSIRELGAGVVVEAMACGMYSLVVDYGGPADLVADDRGRKLPMAPLEGLVTSFRAEMEACADPAFAPRLLAARRIAVGYAFDHFRWQSKAEFTDRVYRALLSGAGLTELREG